MLTYSLSNPLAGSGSTPAALKARDEIRPLQAALKKAHLFAGEIDGIFGAGTGDACKKAKWRLGYPTSACVRTGGQQLLDYLTGAEHLPLAYTIRRHLRGYGLTRDDKLRAQIVKWARWGVANEPKIHYSMSGVRDDWLAHPAGTLPLTTDCSGFVTACYRWAGCKDPSALDYRYVGYTGTLLDNGDTIPVWQAKPGDLVIWGWHPGHHVAVIVDMRNPADPVLVSHGREGGPNEITLSAETAAQRRSYVVKRYSL